MEEWGRQLRPCEREAVEHTVGGKAPATACGADNASAVERVVYSADYYFYTDGTASKAP